MLEQYIQQDGWTLLQVFTDHPVLAPLIVLRYPTTAGGGVETKLVNKFQALFSLLFTGADSGIFTLQRSIM